MSCEEDVHQPVVRRRKSSSSSSRKATYSFGYENSCSLGYIWHQLIPERGERSVEGAPQKIEGKKPPLLAWNVRFSIFPFAEPSSSKPERFIEVASPFLRRRAESDPIGEQRECVISCRPRLRALMLSATVLHPLQAFSAPATARE